MNPCHSVASRFVLSQYVYANLRIESIPVVGYRRSSP